MRDTGMATRQEYNVGQSIAIIDGKQLKTKKKVGIDAIKKIKKNDINKKQI